MFKKPRAPPSRLQPWAGTWTLCWPNLNAKSEMGCLTPRLRAHSRSIGSKGHKIGSLCLPPGNTVEPPWSLSAGRPSQQLGDGPSRRNSLPLFDADLSIRQKIWLLPPRASRCYGHAAINKPRLTAFSVKQDWLTNYGCAPTNAQPVPLWTLHPRFPCVFQEMPLALSASPCLCSTPRSMLNSVAHLSMFIG